MLLPYALADTTEYLQNDEALHTTYFGIHEESLVDPTLELPTDVTTWNSLPPIAINSFDYPNLWSDDGVYVESPSMGWNGQWVSALFDWTISETVSTISQIDVVFDGQSPQEACPPGGNDVYLMAYNRTLDQWEVLDSSLDDACTGGCTLTGSISSNIEQYVDSSTGALRLIATRSDFPIITTLYSDYIQVVVTFTPAAAPPEGEFPEATCAEAGGMDCAFAEWCSTGHLNEDYRDTETCCLGLCRQPSEGERGEPCVEGIHCASELCQDRACVDCLADDDCDEDKYCTESYACEPVDRGACGRVQDHRWLEFECCEDRDCDESAYCKENACRPVVPEGGWTPPGKLPPKDLEYGPGVSGGEPLCGYVADHEFKYYMCCQNIDCYGDEYCDLESHSCKKLTKYHCGYVDLERHFWVSYQCCADDDCLPFQTCLEHQCLARELVAPPSQGDPMAPLVALISLLGMLSLTYYLVKMNILKTYF
jgi:hypothetical protein